MEVLALEPKCSKLQCSDKLIEGLFMWLELGAFSNYITQNLKYYLRIVTIK